MHVPCAQAATLECEAQSHPAITRDAACCRAFLMYRHLHCAAILIVLQASQVNHLRVHDAHCMLKA